MPEYTPSTMEPAPTEKGAEGFQIYTSGMYTAATGSKTYPGLDSVLFDTVGLETSGGAADRGADNNEVVINTGGLWKVEMALASSSGYADALPQATEIGYEENGGEILVERAVSTSGLSGEYATFSDVHEFTQGETVSTFVEPTSDLTVDYYTWVNMVRISDV